LLKRKTPANTKIKNLKDKTPDFKLTIGLIEIRDEITIMIKYNDKINIIFLSM
jgi:hypothetical protein|tara:strand:+ start:430 stop:588 length:159 start_codon:yes stop_codon:yes gene_type:complete